MSFFNYSHRTADAIRSDGGRNPIRRRTRSDQTADAIRRLIAYFLSTHREGISA